MHLFSHVHDPLLNRLSGLVQQRSFDSLPRQWWVTSNGFDENYLRTLSQLAPIYGVRGIVQDDGSFFRKEHPLLDAVGESYGGGLLPYLALDRFSISPAMGDVFIQIDRPGLPGPQLATWGNVFGLSASVLTGNSDAKVLEDDYAETCFNPAGQEVHYAFELARTAIEKSFRVFGTISLMDGSYWPRSLEWLTCLVQHHPILGAPSRNTVNEIDIEKIEALEAAHDAWRILDGVRLRFNPTVFLWLEHYFLNLKIVCHILRLLADVFFSIRGCQMKKMSLPGHALRSKYRELYGTVRENCGLLADFEPRSIASGGHPMGDLLKAMADKIEKLVMVECNRSIENA